MPPAPSTPAWLLSSPSANPQSQLPRLPLRLRPRIVTGLEQVLLRRLQVRSALDRRRRCGIGNRPAAAPRTMFVASFTRDAAASSWLLRFCSGARSHRAPDYPPAFKLSKPASLALELGELLPAHRIPGLSVPVVPPRLRALDSCRDAPADPARARTVRSGAGPRCLMARRRRSTPGRPGRGPASASTCAAAPVCAEPDGNGLPTEHGRVRAHQRHPKRVA